MALNHEPPEDQGSPIKQQIKQQIKHQASQAARKGMKKVGKKAGKAAAKAAAKAIKIMLLVLKKMLIAFLSFIGVPSTFVTLAIVCIVAVLLLISSIFFGEGKELDDDQQKLHDYMMEQITDQVNTDSNIQMNYRVPEGLVSAIIQINEMHKEHEDYYELIDTTVDKLKPTFTYESFETADETKSQTCSSAGQCTESPSTTSTSSVKRLTEVTAWNGKATFTYGEEWGPWQKHTTKNEDGSSSTTWTRSKQAVVTGQKQKEDYTKLDEILDSFGYKMSDKKMVEAFYEASGGIIHYTEWLKNGKVAFDNVGIDIIGVGSNGNIVPGKGVPPQFMPLYLKGQSTFGTPWYYIAAVHSIETQFSTNASTSSAGAFGQTQFMPCTWVGWSYPGCKGSKGNVVMPKETYTSLSVIARYGGYGVDGNGDGKADPWNLDDAIMATAKYLGANGMPSDPKKAFYTYNNANWYVTKAINLGEKFKNEAKEIPVGGGGSSSSSAVVNAGSVLIGKTVYVFGGGRNQGDINAGRFDCSSFVHWAFAQVGIDLGNRGWVSTETLKNLGTPVPVSDMQPGDLVFFDTYKKDGHVGIYAGNGKFLGCQGKTGVAFADMSKGYFQRKFNGRVRRI
ncbi:NlpC/P60 family protein [Priestia koreensis]|uniref:C40 family peptidase n=1 Tax=Priestia koreensis TaxID=284581 RepID=UPI003CFCD5C6